MHQEIIDKLYSEYKSNGYVSEDSVFDALIDNNLPLDEINVLCNNLLAMGVIIRSDDAKEDEVIYDRSQTDYEKLYNEVVEIEPELKPFIDEAKGITPPQNREWQNLMLSAQNGNLYSRDRIITMYMRLVVKSALWHYRKFGITLSDAIQNGCIGLVTALEKYESGRHNNFSQHASLWIRQFIMRDADPINSLIYYPAHYKEKIFATYEMYSTHECEFCGSNLRCPKLLNDIVNSLNCSNEEAIELMNHLIPMESIDELLENDERAFFDYNIFEEQLSDNFNRKELIDALELAIKGLSPKEVKVLKLRFGFDGKQEMTLEEVGKIFGVTRERIRQIEAKAIKKLQHPNKTKVFKNFLT